jgi:hypothetical protein
MYISINRKKMIAWFICIFLIMVLSLSYLFIVTHKKHQCTGDKCPICEQLQLAEHIIAQIKTAVLPAIILLVSNIFVYESKKNVHIFHESDTLIKRKVRLNN